MGTGLFDDRPHRVEQAAADALVRVADVFGDQREQDPPDPAVRHLPGEHVEKVEKRRLSARGDGDVFRADLPAEGFAEQAGDGGDEVADCRAADRSW